MKHQIKFETRDDSRHLSEKDRDLLLNFLKKSPEPNETLKTAYDKIASTCYLNNNDKAIYDIDLKT